MESTPYQAVPLVESTKPPNVLYKYRWVIALCFALTSFQNMMAWTVYSPIQRKLQDSYELSFAYINFGTTVIQNYAAIPGTLLANYVFDYHGIGPGIIVGGLMTIGGLWIRILSVESFWYIIIGQALCGIAQPFYVNTTQTISSLWFGPKERVWSTSFLNLFLTIGSGIGGLVPQYFVRDRPGHGALEQIKDMNFFMAVVASVASIPAFLLIRSKPPTPPSDEITIERFSYLKSLKDLFVNKNSFIFLIGSSFIYGTMLTSSYVFQAQFTPFGFNSDQASTTYALSNFLSPPFYFLAGILIKCFGGYKKSLLFLSLIWSITLFGLIPISYTESIFLIGAFYVYMTCISCPPIALCLEFIVELSYPVGETAAGGMFTVVSQQLSSLVALLCDLVLNKGSKEGSVISYIILGSFSVVGFIMVFFVKEDLRRTEFAKKQAERPDGEYPPQQKKISVLRSVEQGSFIPPEPQVFNNNYYNNN